MDHPATAERGDMIEHELMPGFRMEVLDSSGCETDSSRPEPHKMYRVKDPSGSYDWLCAYDVVKLA